MKLAYLAGALRDPEAPNEMTPRRLLNIARARAAARDLTFEGLYPVCPHLLTGDMAGEIEEAAAMEAARELLRRCDELRLIVGWELSAGTWDEIAVAAEAGLPIFLPDGSPLRAVVFRGEVRMLHTSEGLLFAETGA